MKPKLWDGANAVGEAKVRHLQTIDAPYLTASGPGFTAHKAGGFSEVTGHSDAPSTSEPSLFANGYAGEQFCRREAAYPQGFTPSQKTLPATNLGNGYGSDVHLTPDDPHSEWATVYPRRDLGYSEQVAIGWASGGIVVVMSKRAPLAQFEHTYETPHLPQGGAGFTLYGGATLGRRAETDRGCFAHYWNYMSSRLDGWGNPVVNIRYAVVTGNCTQYAEADLPRPSGVTGERGYILGATFSFGPTSLGVFVGEQPLVSQEPPGGTIIMGFGTPPETYNAYEEARGRVLLYTSTDSGNSWTIREFTPLTAPAGNDGTPDTILGHRWMNDSEVYFASPAYEYGMHGVRIVDFLVLGHVAVFSPTVWAVFSVVTDQRYYGGVQRPLRAIVERTTDAGATWATVGTPLGDSVFDISCTALRAGVALARCAPGTVGVGRTVRFIRTYDSGATWEEVTPEGLPATTNERIGFFEVLAADESVGESTVALVCYNDEDAAYVMYVSKDDGATWERTRTVKHSEVFRRVDSDTMMNESNDTMENFGRLDYRGTIAHPNPIDIAQPWRHDALVPPPAD